MKKSPVFTGLFFALSLFDIAEKAACLNDADFEEHSSGMVIIQTVMQYIAYTNPASVEKQQSSAMHKTLKRLYRDHAHFSQLLDILEQQLDLLKANQSTDFKLLLEIVDYLSDYVDANHHPIEDQLYQTMLARTDSGREPMERLLSEHLITIDLTRKLRNAINSRENIEQIGRECIDHQRQHMEYEEKEAFSWIKNELDDDAIDIATAAIPDVRDPMDSDMRERYPTLASLIPQ